MDYIEASKEVIIQNKLTSKDIDLVIYVSQQPECLAPTCSKIILNDIGGNSNAICFDMNANCIGMVSALDTTVCYMRGNSRIKKALIIHSDKLSKNQIQ